MFSTVRLVAACSALGILTGCNFEQPVTQKLAFSVESDTDTCSDREKEINLGDDETFQTYRKNIKSVELTELKVTILNGKSQPSSLATKANGTLSIMAESGGEKLTLSTYGDVALTDGNTVDIQYDSAGATRMAELIMNPPNRFILHSNGCADQAPAYFTAEAVMTLIFHASL
jgi:hypothetical protein